jgi:hypothetical protein
VFKAALLLAIAAVMCPASHAAMPARDRIAILKPRPPEQLSVSVDLSLAGIVPGVEAARAKSRGRALASVLQKEGFDLLQTLELQVAAALPDYYLRRVATSVPPLSRSKSEGADAGLRLRFLARSGD